MKTFTRKIDGCPIKGTLSEIIEAFNLKGGTIYLNKVKFVCSKQKETQILRPHKFLKFTKH